MLFNIFLFFMFGGLVIYVGFFLMMYLSSRPKFNNATIINKALSNQYYYKPDSIVHAMNGNFFSLGSTALENADRETFEVIAYNLAKDKNQVYYNEIIIKDAEPISFTPIYNKLEVEDKPYIQYSKDKNNVYYTLNKIESADPKSFEHLGGDYTRDKNSLFYCDKHLCSLNDNNNPVAPLPIKNDHKEIYCRVKNEIFFKGISFENVDSNSFIALENEFSKDKNTVYLQTKPLPEVDADSFEVLNDSFQRDYKHLYYNTKIIQNSDPHSYEFFSILFSKDKNQVYYCGRVLLEVKVDSFNLSDGKNLDENRKYVNLTLDDNHCAFALRKKCIDILEFPDDQYSSRHCQYRNDIYYGYSKMIGVDLESFSIIPNSNQSYSKDKNNAYYSNQVINGADPDTFKAINDMFAIDKDNVYYTTSKIKDQKPDSFKYQENMWGEEISEGLVALRTEYDWAIRLKDE